jgi:hypothetical protein
VGNGWALLDFGALTAKGSQQYLDTKDEQGSYQEIQFGLPLKYEVFSPLFRAGEIYIDCGMHQGNARPYMMWRASNRVWDKLAEI